MAKQQLNSAQTKNTVSSAEVDTGKLWIDGRTIYRKAITGTINIIVGDTNLAHGISGLTTSFLPLSVAGSIAIGGGATNITKQSFQYRETGGNWCSHTATDQTNLIFRASFAWGSSYVSAVMEYVK